MQKIDLALVINCLLEVRRGTNGDDLAGHHLALNNLYPSRIEVSPPLPGSFEPTQLDPELRNEMAYLARQQFGERNVIEEMISVGGQDTMWVQRAGIQSLFAFIRSEEGGICHNPAEAMDPADVEKGARFLAHAVLQSLEEYRR